MTRMAKVGEYVKFTSNTWGWTEPPLGTSWPNPGDILQVREVINDCYRFVGLYYPYPDSSVEREYKMSGHMFTLVKKIVVFNDILNPSVEWVVDNKTEE